MIEIQLKVGILVYEPCNLVRAGCSCLSRADLTVRGKHNTNVVNGSDDPGIKYGRLTFPSWKLQQTEGNILEEQIAKPATLVGFFYFGHKTSFMFYM
jgi:hypothetical protein